ncbi:NUDIX domain-containing protein [Deinococcus aquiradiocola]|uniref:ADP-ribose pyrophosphatase n=1 Tax=Deinococcus aquiradiocola TaxID=393059 RepID=A0A917UJW8_9DEIO|nr:NUDIX domain-containing protein [Deinococcus aquiradiocola]GGJ61926.1 ADP-ribose pyrophosphatase [Deinococcus aquiradiocola]
MRALLRAFSRREVTRPPRQLVGAGVLCLNARGEVLLVRRGDNGRWDVPGGRVEPGEATDAAARRELHEETTLTAGAFSLLGVFSGPDTLHTYPDGNTVAWVTVLYLTRDVSGMPTAADDACEARWFPPGEVPGPLSPATRQYLQALHASLHAGTPGPL